RVASYATELCTLSLHDALPIWSYIRQITFVTVLKTMASNLTITHLRFDAVAEEGIRLNGLMAGNYLRNGMASVMLRATCTETHRDRKSTRLNSSHVKISYAVFC